MMQILMNLASRPKKYVCKVISCKNCQTHPFKMRQYVCPTMCLYKTFSNNIYPLK